jgi:2-succinyl-6-hydroxy-2,4-cyclohexadiene-1-carboxylate synthase
VNGLHLNVEVAGAGRPLLLLHGFTGSAVTWLQLMERLEGICRLLAVDLLGHGRSDSPEASERYRVERQIEDLTALLDRMGVAEYDLLGYSMGGRLAMHLALAHGERIGRLVLESASPGITDPAERAARVRDDERLARLLEEQGITPFVDYWEHLPLFASQDSLPSFVRAALRSQRLACHAAGLAGSLRGFGAGLSEPLYDRLSELPPTLLIAGERDGKYSSLARVMGAHIPDAQVAIVPGAGHTVHLERPDEFADLVSAYMQAKFRPHVESAHVAAIGVARPSAAVQSDATQPPREEI